MKDTQIMPSLKDKDSGGFLSPSARITPSTRHYLEPGVRREMPSSAFRVICHLDIDAFYASVEQRDNPTLRGQPVIVGAPPTQRGVVCAASYEARKFGVHSAMPSATAGRLCPKGIFVRPRMEAYKDESRQIMQLVAETGAVIEQMSIDEAYLDLSGLLPGGGCRCVRCVVAARWPSS